MKYLKRNRRKSCGFSKRSNKKMQYFMVHNVTFVIWVVFNKSFIFLWIHGALFRSIDFIRLECIQIHGEFSVLFLSIRIGICNFHYIPLTSQIIGIDWQAAFTMWSKNDNFADCKYLMSKNNKKQYCMCRLSHRSLFTLGSLSSHMSFYYNCHHL